MRKTRKFRSTKPGETRREFMDDAHGEIHQIALMLLPFSSHERGVICDEARKKAARVRWKK